MANDYGVNPFESPRETDEFLGAKDSVIQILDQTRPWVRLLTIVGMIGVGFMALAVVFMLVGGMAGAGRGELTVMAAMYILMIGLYVYPLVCLWRYASRIKQLTLTGDKESLLGALDAQRGFWKFMGIMMLIVFGFYALMLVVMMVGFAVGGMN